jgi:DNA modification methylase
LLADGLDLSSCWSEEEFQKLFGEGVRSGKTDPDAVPPLRQTAIRRGDLFVLGAHRLLCGDATDAADVARLLAGATPRLTSTDAPYGVNYDPSWRAAVDGSDHHALGRVTNDDRADWGEAFALSPSDVIYAWHGGLHADTVAGALKRCGFELRAQVIWVKPHFVLSRGDLHWQHEPCWYAVRKGRSSNWLGDRTQSTVWEVAHLNPIGGDRAGANTPTGHATQKPVALFERPLLHHTVPGEAVYEPFAGSGSCLIAAEKTGRRCYAMEIHPVYVQVILDRWSAFTGRTPEPGEA